MRSLERNKQKLYYATYHDKTVVYQTDADGNIVYVDIDGVQVPIEISANEAGYSAPVLFKANISAGRGSSDDDVFGKNLDYTRAITSCDMTLPITNTSKIWFETEPVLNDDGSANADSADYDVVLAPHSLNSISIAIKARKKNGAV